MQSIQAVADKIVVRILKEETTEGGLILPDNVKQVPQGYGEVVSVGEDVKKVEVGDIIAFHERGGQDILMNREVWKVLGYGEIYGILVEVVEEKDAEPSED